MMPIVVSQSGPYMQRAHLHVHVHVCMCLSHTALQTVSFPHSLHTSGQDGNVHLGLLVPFMLAHSIERLYMHASWYTQCSLLSFHTYTYLSNRHCALQTLLYKLTISHVQFHNTLFGCCVVYLVLYLVRTHM